MSRWPTATFQVSIMSKWLAKHISTKDSFKITIRKRHVYIDIRWPWKWNQYFYLGIWGGERSKIIFLPFISARYTIKFTEQKWNKFINELWHINCIWILAFPIGIILVSAPQKWRFFYFISVPYTITDLQPL